MRIKKLLYEKADTIVISDIHIGSNGNKTAKLHRFLDTLLRYPPKRLVIAGDLFEMWSTNYRKIGKYEYKIIRKILELSEHGIKVVYIPGNHDRAFRAFRKLTLGKIKVRREYIIKRLNKRYLVVHGDEFDAFTRNHVVVSIIIDQLYVALVKFSSFWKTFFGIDISFSAKKRSKKYAKVITKIKKASLRYAKSRKVDGIVIGHTHWPEVAKDIDGIVYANAGDWVDNCSYVVVGKRVRLEFFD